MGRGHRRAGRPVRPPARRVPGGPWSVPRAVARVRGALGGAEAAVRRPRHVRPVSKPSHAPPGVAANPPRGAHVFRPPTGGRAGGNPRPAATIRPRMVRAPLDEASHFPGSCGSSTNSRAWRPGKPVHWPAVPNRAHESISGVIPLGRAAFARRAGAETTPARPVVALAERSACSRGLPAGRRVAFGRGARRAVRWWRGDVVGVAVRGGVGGRKGRGGGPRAAGRSGCAWYGPERRDGNDPTFSALFETSAGPNHPSSCHNRTRPAGGRWRGPSSSRVR